ncbi:hypothetical protein ACA910_018098 [Epithemia clementina (nom. ined.)]
MTTSSWGLLQLDSNVAVGMAEGSSIRFLWTTILLPPTLALVYAVSSAVFLSYFGECPWRTHFPHVVVRLSVWIVFVAVVVPTLRTAADELQQQRQDKVFGWLTALAVHATTSLALSAYLIRQTRIHVVEGGRAPKIVSSNHLQGKVVLITGANTGIGKETAMQLAEQGAKIILACRSASKAQVAKNEILNHLVAKKKKDPDNNNSNDNNAIEILPLDLSSLASVRKAALMVQENKWKVDILILNAGVMMGKQVITEDGYELMMQANHLGHYYLTRLLLDNGAINTTVSTPSSSSSSSTPPNTVGKVLVITSSTYRFTKCLDLEDLFCTTGKRNYTLFGQYEMSKLANIMFVQELHRRYNKDGDDSSSSSSSQKLFTAAIHPGLVRTDVVRNMPWYLYYPNTMFAWALQTLQKTPAQGAWCTTFLATATDPTTSSLSGKYWVNQTTQELWPCAQDRDAALALWNKSARYVGMDP